MKAFVPWEQLPDETGPAWAAFVAYRDLGPTRTVVAAAKLVGRVHGSITKFVQPYEWHARVRAWDAEVDRVRREQLLKKQRDLIKIHADVGRELREKAMDAVKEITVKMLAADPKAALAYLQAAIKIEQQSVGMPTEVTALQVRDGQTVDTTEIYFDSLPKEKLIPLIEISLQSLKAEAHATAAPDPTIAERSPTALGREDS